MSHQENQISILIVSDFFYPRVGGVEVHMYQLACSLIRLGYKVTVLSHNFKDRQGVRYIGNGIKTYYNPMIPWVDDTSIPILFGAFKVFREIIIKEKVNLVHCHQGTSVTAQECLMHARTMGLNTVFTDHSLFGFGDIAEVNINKVMRSMFTDLDQSISVSHIARDNLIMRSMFNPRKTNVIPNGVDFTKFLPDTTKDKSTDIINIVSISRQTSRKGTDFLVEIIPEICKMYKNVNFIIGGDGPKKPWLDHMVISSGLEKRVSLVGSWPHNKVREYMIKGHIYLNTSLTESFCIAIVESASTGWYNVATDVGGVGEVLHSDMVKLVSPDKSSIIKGWKEAIDNYKIIQSKTKGFNNVWKDTYNWYKIAKKTCQVFDKALLNKDRSIITRIKKALGIGRISGVFYVCLICCDYLWLIFWMLLFPGNTIKKDREFRYDNYKKYLSVKMK